MFRNKRDRGSRRHRAGSVKRTVSFVSLLGLLAGLVVVLAAAAPASGPPGLAQAIAAKDRHVGELFAHPGIVGAGVGLDNGQAVVVVLRTSDRVAGIPGTLDGVKVAVRVTGPISALGATTAVPLDAKRGGVNPASYFKRPVPIGVSTGNADQCIAGTIGARVKDASGNVYALSNNHVYAEENAGIVGQTTVTQPGLVDGRPPCQYKSAYDLGTLSAFVPINFSGGVNTVDAAIAQTTPSNLGNATPTGGYGTPSSTIASLNPGKLLNAAVQKYGRTTGLTQGTVCITNLTVNIGYTSAVARFVHQIAICNGDFSDFGDSGSLIVTAHGNHPVGLLFAIGNGITIANPIDAVLSDLRVSIDGS